MPDSQMELGLALLVLRCNDVEATHRFYQLLGLVFHKEQHGNGPRHYASESAGFVLELYPATADHPADKLRLGFTASSLAEVFGTIQHSSEMNVLKPPYAAADRQVMLLQDPDGRKVEISQQLHR